MPDVAGVSGVSERWRDEGPRLHQGLQPAGLNARLQKRGLSVRDVCSPGDVSGALWEAGSTFPEVGGRGDVPPPTHEPPRTPSVPGFPVGGGRSWDAAAG